GNQYELSIWELATGKTLHRFLTSARVVETVAISPNGAWAVYGGGGRETPDAAFLELIDIRTGHRSVVEFSAKNDFASNGMTAMAISPDGNELCIALSSADDGISWQHRLLSTRLKFSSRTKQEQPADAPIPPGAGDWRNLSVLRTGLGTDLEYSQDGQHIAFALWNPQKVEIWNAASGTLAASRDLLSDDFDAFAFEKDDQLVIAGNFATKSIENSGTIVNQTMSSPPALLQWDWRSNKLQTSQFPAPVDISCLQYSVQHESWIIGFVGGRLNVWRPGTVEPFTELSGHQPKECWGVAFSPDSHRIYSVGDDASLNVWDTTTQGLITRRQQQTQLTSCVAVSPDGRWIATGSYDNTVVVWQAESLNVQYTLSGHTRAVRTIAFSPDSMTLASSGRDGNVCIWNMSDGTLKVTHHDDDSTIRAVEFYAEDALVNVNAKGRIAARSLQSGQQVLRNEGQEVHSLAIAPSGTLIPVPPLFAGQHPNSPILKAAAGDLLLYGEKFGPFKLLHVPTRSLWLEQHYPGTDIRSLAFTPDGRTFAVAGDDHAVHLWHVASGQEVLTFSDLPAAVNQVAFSPDGQHLAAALHDGTIRIWHAPQ
ncbi:MAG: WD40 repeat domain-containing protein, partial [Planctomycetaceae bacterium]|nr:WD40 repeat domain-containing protein [Planctomycetaceae bacterium]